MFMFLIVVDDVSFLMSENDDVLVVFNDFFLEILQKKGSLFCFSNFRAKETQELKLTPSYYCIFNLLTLCFEFVWILGKVLN